MRVRIGDADRPAGMRAIERRRLLRRFAVNVWSKPTGRGPFAIEDITSVDRRAALDFRPRLRDDVRLEATSVKREGYEIELDTSEYDFLCVCDGQHTTEQAVGLAWGNGEQAPDDSARERALQLLGALGRFDMLVTGVQGP